jgi:hypothetical protein
VDTVRTWRGRFADLGLPGLADCKRPGRPAAFTALQAAQVKALACRLPAEAGAPLSRWSCPELAREAVERGIAPFLSASTVRHWLDQDALKPWHHRSWIFITDPDFRPKAERVLDLYARAWDGIPLGADEKTSIQARCRCHPTPAPGRARAMRVSHTYGRGSALAYLAAYDVHQATVFGHCEPTTGIAPFMALVAQVMRQEPYAIAKRVFWIVDNGSSHRGKAATDRLVAARSSSPSCSAKSWRPTTLPTSPRSGTGSEPSKTATTPEHGLSCQARPADRRSLRRILRHAGSMINRQRTSGADHIAP